MQTISYTMQGDGKPVLLVHGWAMRGSVWGSFADCLCEAGRVITVDLRGHGNSAAMPGPYTFPVMAEDILQLMDHLNLERVTLVGWSMGFLVLLKLLALDHARVDSIVCISGTPSLVNREAYSCGVAPVVVKRLMRQLERGYPEGLQSFFSLLPATEEKDVCTLNPAFRKATDIANAPPRTAALESLACLRDEDGRTAIKTLFAPALLIHGDRDVVCPPAAAYYMHRRIPQSKLVMLEHSGHIPFLTQREHVAAEVKRFIRQI